MDIENKEVRGITAKLLIGIIIQTAVIVATATGFYFTLKSDIKIVTTEKNNDSKYWQLKFDQLQLQNAAFQKQLDYIQIRLDNIAETQQLKSK